MANDRREAPLIIPQPNSSGAKAHSHASHGYRPSPHYYSLHHHSPSNHPSPLSMEAAAFDVAREGRGREEGGKRRGEERGGRRRDLPAVRGREAPRLGFHTLQGSNPQHPLTRAHIRHIFISSSH